MIVKRLILCLCLLAFPLSGMAVAAPKSQPAASAKSKAKRKAVRPARKAAGKANPQIVRAELERLRKAQAEARRGGLAAEMTRMAESATAAPGGRWVVAEIEGGAEPDAVRDAADGLRGALKRGGAVLAVRSAGKLTFVAAVTDDLVAEKRLRADELVRSVARVTGGSGGGKPHLALAGGMVATKLGEALSEARRLLAEALSG